MTMWLVNAWMILPKIVWMSSALRLWMLGYRDVDAIHVLSDLKRFEHSTGDPCMVAMIDGGKRNKRNGQGTIENHACRHVNVCTHGTREFAGWVQAFPGITLTRMLTCRARVITE